MVSETPLLSIIVPNYNNEPYIQDCIESILTQTYRNFEIIVSDDFSTDRSVAIIKKYEQLHGNTIKGLYSDLNRGVSLNRHTAILKSRGEYITTIDSDDYYCDEKKLEKEMAIVLAHRKKLAKDVCAFSNIVQVTGEKELLQVVGTPETICEGIIFDGIITRSCFIPRDFIFPKSAYFAVGGFDPLLRIYEDWDLKIRLAAKYEFYYSGINGISYRRHCNGLSSAPLVEHIETLEKIFKKNIFLAANANRQSLSDQFGKIITTFREQAEHEALGQVQEIKPARLLSSIHNVFRSLKLRR